MQELLLPINHFYKKFVYVLEDKTFNEIKICSILEKVLNNWHSKDRIKNINFTYLEQLS